MRGTGAAKRHRSRMISRLKHDATQRRRRRRPRCADMADITDSAYDPASVGGSADFLANRPHMQERNRDGLMREHNAVAAFSALGCVESLLCDVKNDWGALEGGTHQRIDQRGSRAQIKDRWHFTCEGEKEIERGRRLSAKKLNRALNS